MILVGGEALYDLVLQGSDDDLHGHPGGGPFNTARTIGRLEQPVAYLGRLSSDRFGQRLEALLADDGVSLECVVRTDDPTTLALAEVDDDGVARYRFYERGTAAPGLTPEAALEALPADVDMLHVGTLGLALEPVATALEGVVEPRYDLPRPDRVALVDGDLDEPPTNLRRHRRLVGLDRARRRQRHRRPGRPEEVAREAGGEEDEKQQRRRGRGPVAPRFSARFDTDSSISSRSRLMWVITPVPHSFASSSVAR